MQGRGSKGGVSTAMPNDLKIPKPPKQPDKPLPAYMRYSRKVWESVKSQHPDMKMWDIGKLIGEQWRNLPENERQAFFAEYEVEKSEYQEAMKEYHNSTAYREWLKAKERAMNAMQEQQMMEKSMGGSIPKEEPRFQLQQIEDDDDEGDFSIKHVAAARFQRNHRLIVEIFSEAAVPDIKTVVTKPRLENLKRQVQSLMQHQRKLEGEIEEMESKFSAKKQKILDEAKTFADSMEEIASRPIPEIRKEEKSGKKCENENASKEQNKVDSVVMATDPANVDSYATPALVENNEAVKIKSLQDNEECLQNTLPRNKTEVDQYQ